MDTVARNQRDRQVFGQVEAWQAAPGAVFVLTRKVWSVEFQVVQVLFVPRRGFFGWVYAVGVHPDGGECPQCNVTPFE